MPRGPVSNGTRRLAYEYGANELMSKYDRMRPAVKPANWMKPRSTHSVSAVAAVLSPVPLPCVDHCAPASMYDRSVPYSVCVRRSTLTPARVRKPKLAVSVRVSLPAIASLALPPAPFGVSLLSLFQDVWTRMNEPIFKHVSVPGTYQKPAPYRLQTFTYSTGLAFTGRSAACAPATATRPAAEPRRRLLTIRIVTLHLMTGRDQSAMCPPPGAPVNFRSRKPTLA